MGPIGGETFKTLLLYIAAKAFQTLPEFSSQGRKNTLEIF